MYILECHSTIEKKFDFPISYLLLLNQIMLIKNWLNFHKENHIFIGRSSSLKFYTYPIAIKLNV